jgi:hypothetical protein
MAILDKVFRWLGHGRYYSSLPTPASNGDVVEQLFDAYGRAVVVPGTTAPSGVTATRQLTAANTGALASGAASLVEVSVWNSGAVALWFQVHDKSAAVGSGDACVDQVYVPAGGTVGWRPLVPVAATTRLRWAASTTASTYTAPGTAACGFSAAVSS